MNQRYRLVDDLGWVLVSEQTPEVAVAALPYGPALVLAGSAGEIWLALVPQEDEDPVHGDSSAAGEVATDNLGCVEADRVGDGQRSSNPGSADGISLDEVLDRLAAERADLPPEAHDQVAAFLDELVQVGLLRICPSPSTEPVSANDVPAPLA